MPLCRSRSRTALDEVMFSAVPVDDALTTADATATEAVEAYNGETF